MKRMDLGVLCACLMLVAIALASFAKTAELFGAAVVVTLLLQGSAILCFLTDARPIDEGTPSVIADEDVAKPH